MVRIAVPRLESIPSIPINNTDTIFVPVIPSRRNISAKRMESTVLDLSMGTTLLISPFWRAWKQQYHHCPDCCCHIRIRFLNSTFCQNRCDSRKKGRTYWIKYPHTSHLPKTSSFHNADKFIRLWIIRHVIHLFVAISQILEQGSFLVTLLCINIRGQFCEISIFITVKA